MRNNFVCPKDGQTLAWHMRFQEFTALGEPRYFGDILGCGFITPIDRLNRQPTLGSQLNLNPRRENSE